MRKLICLTAAALACSACNKPSPPTPTAAQGTPPEVIAMENNYAAQCKQLGGDLTGAWGPKVTEVDLDGDGKPDYILDPEQMSCSASETLYVPNGGVALKVALSRNAYKQPLEILGARPTVVDVQGGKELHILVQRTNCPDAQKTDVCEAVYSWVGGKYAQKYQVKK